MTKTEARTADQQAHHLDECTTQHLLDTYRSWPTADVAQELETRGVTLWHHGLAKVSG
jgi:hypothetical protein